MFKSKLFEVHHNLFPQYEYAYTKWWKWYVICSSTAVMLQQLMVLSQHSSTGSLMMLLQRCRFKFCINIVSAAFAVLAEVFLLGSLGSKAVNALIPICLAGR